MSIISPFPSHLRPCTCDDSCYGYSPCNTCDDECYNYDGYVCDTCDATCYEYSACTCDYSCYSYVAI